MSITVNPTNNRVNGWVYDANGNVTQQGSFFGSYDVENRLSEATKNGSVRYGYRADNRRIYESRRGTENAGGDANRRVCDVLARGSADVPVQDGVGYDAE